MRRLLGLVLLLAGFAALLAVLENRPSAHSSILGEHVVLRGQVRDARGPLAGTRVRLQGTAVAAETDAEGHFRLPRRPSVRRVTAWKEGYFIAGASVDDHPPILRLVPLPGEDHEAYRWIDPTPHAGAKHNCANCHPDIYRE